MLEADKCFAPACPAKVSNFIFFLLVVVVVVTSSKLAGVCDNSINSSGFNRLGTARPDPAGACRLRDLGIIEKSASQ